jgi:hypothetical protein
VVSFSSRASAITVQKNSPATSCLHLRLAESNRWLYKRPKKNRYNQTKITIPQPHWRRGLAAKDDQLLTWGNVFFQLLARDFSRDPAPSRSFGQETANIAPSISATIGLLHRGGGFRSTSDVSPTLYPADTFGLLDFSPAASHK